MTPLRVTPSIQLDPGDPAFRSDPHPFYRRLREHGPVTRSEDEGSWIVSGYDEVRSLLRDARTGIEGSDPGTRLVSRAEHPFLRARGEARELFSLFVHNREPPDHARLRRVARAPFSPRQVAARQERIQELTDDIIDGALLRGRLDVVGELGRPVALTIAEDVLGIPDDLRPSLDPWAGRIGEQMEVLAGAAGREAGVLAMMALVPRLRELVAGWRSDPPANGGLLWTLETARAQGALTEREAVSLGVLLLFAGHITAQHLIGNGVLALLRDPEQWNLLRSRPEIVGTAIDELVRYDGPVAMTPRTALDDIEIGAETIRRGDLILLALSAANRDPAVFADPDRLDLTRSPNPHLGFGHDAHYCLGAPLGKLEAEIAIGTLVRRVPPPRLESEQLEWQEALFMRGLSTVPILLS